jgi:hypothetical protein
VKPLATRALPPLTGKYRRRPLDGEGGYPSPTHPDWPPGTTLAKLATPPALPHFPTPADRGDWQWGRGAFRVQRSMGRRRPRYPDPLREPHSHLPPPYTDWMATLWPQREPLASPLPHFPSVPLPHRLDGLPPAAQLTPLTLPPTGQLTDWPPLPTSPAPFGASPPHLPTGGPKGWGTGHLWPKGGGNISRC